MGLFDKFFGTRNTSTSNQNSNPFEEEYHYVEGRGFLLNVHEVFHEDGWLQEIQSVYWEKVHPDDELYEPDYPDEIQWKDKVSVFETFDKDGKPHSYNGKPSINIFYWEEDELDCKWHKNGVEVFDGQVVAPWLATQTWKEGRLVSEEYSDRGNYKLRLFDKDGKLHNNKGAAEVIGFLGERKGDFTEVFAEHGEVYREERTRYQDEEVDKIITHFLDDGKTIKTRSINDKKSGELWYKDERPYTPSAHELLAWEARKAEEAAQAEPQGSQEAGVEATQKPTAHGPQVEQGEAITAMPTTFDQEATTEDAQPDLQDVLESRAARQETQQPKAKKADER